MFAHALLLIVYEDAQLFVHEREGHLEEHHGGLMKTERQKKEGRETGMSDGEQMQTRGVHGTCCSTKLCT